MRHWRLGKLQLLNKLWEGEILISWFLIFVCQRETQHSCSDLAILWLLCLVGFTNTYLFSAFGASEWALGWQRIVQEKEFLHYSFAEVLFLAVQNLGRPYWLTLAPMYIWILIFFSQPHKEERFLFPIYPLICLSGAVALSALQVNSSDF